LELDEECKPYSWHNKDKLQHEDENTAQEPLAWLVAGEVEDGYMTCIQIEQHYDSTWVQLKAGTVQVDIEARKACCRERMEPLTTWGT